MKISFSTKTTHNGNGEESLFLKAQIECDEAEYRKAVADPRDPTVYGALQEALVLLSRTADDAEEIFVDSLERMCTLKTQQGLEIELEADLVEYGVFEAFRMGNWKIQVETGRYAVSHTIESSEPC